MLISVVCFIKFLVVLGVVSLVGFAAVPLLMQQHEDVSGDFKATLYYSSPHSGKDKEWVDEVSSGLNLKDTQKNALVHVKHNGTISNKEYCEINHMNSRNDDRKALRELGEMLEKGLFVKEGAGAGTKYRLAQN